MENQEKEDQKLKPRRSFTLFCFKSRNNKFVTFSKFHRWAIFLTGLIESITFSSCIVGWGQLVYVLKNEEIYLNLCQNEVKYVNESYKENNVSDFHSSVSKEDLILRGCKEQDKAFALIYVISSTLFMGSSIFSGILLHYCGLVITRFISSLTVVFGFLALGFLTKEETYWLNISMILLAIGGNVLRLSEYQFCNLFPKHRSTALTIISGAYASSAGLFLIFQFGQQYGFSMRTVSFGLAGFACLSVVATVFMPWYCVPYNDEEELKSQEMPLSNSLFTISGFLHAFWFPFSGISSLFYSLYFNTWISQIAQTNEEAGHLSRFYSLSFLGCFFFTPLPGLVIDFLLRRAEKAPNEEDRQMLKMKAPFGPLLIVTFISISLMVTLLFKSIFVVYLSLGLILLYRAFLVPTGSAFLRLRFPASHFDRLVGIHTCVSSIIFATQYPYFVWAQKQFTVAMASLITIVVLTLLHPLHLLINPYVKRIAKQKSSPT